MRPDQETLGGYLRRTRQTRHVTAEEIALFIGADRSRIEALEADDFDGFSRRDCLRLVKAYAAYLNLNRTEAVRRFDGQWKLSGGLKRYPKLTHYTDDASRRKKAGFGGKRPLAGVSPAKVGWLAFIAGLLIVGAVLFSSLSEWKPEPSPAELSPSPPIEKKMAPVAESKPAVPIKAIDAGVPKRAPAIDPLYTPPGRAPRNPAPRPAATMGTSAGGEKSARLPGGVRVVGNRDTKRYHLPGMKYYDRVKAYHRVIFQSEREALRAGYVKARE